MSEVRILPLESLGRGFIQPPYLPDGADEYYLRNQQSRRPLDGYRHLRAAEIEVLTRNGNSVDNWDDILVTDQFAPHRIRNCAFHGLVRIGRLEDVVLEHHELCVPVGITHSRIIACDVGDDVAIHHVRYLAHYIIGDRCILLNIDEMHTTNHAKFGNGIVKEGEPESIRVWMGLMNETGTRAVMPFDGMIAGDACLWAKHRDDTELMRRLGDITQRTFDSRRGWYGTVGDHCVIKNSRIIKDVKIGDCCYIKGANKLKNLTIHSTESEPTQIGEGVEMVNGIVGTGCHVFYGCKAVRFVLGQNSNLKYGARLIHSYLGDNSTVSCCEILNNLVFPAHEQHHNNSFLVAALVMGQSNIAAGATIGSNHNSRAPDGEIVAGRGFWPGLCVSLRHNSVFASFTLLAKGDYPAEMNVPLPFSLVSDDPAHDELRIMPAYWWRHNMYALARNTWKFHSRDKRQVKTQHIEFDALAPDTAEEIRHALELLELWTADAHLRSQGQAPEATPLEQRVDLGADLLTGDPQQVAALEIVAQGVENSRRKALIVKGYEGYQSYRDMLHYYAVRNLIDYMNANPTATLDSMNRELAGGRCRKWVNLGGQIVAADDLKALKADISSGRLDFWSAIHAEYDRLWQKYPLDKQRHAFAMLLDLLGDQTLTRETWHEALDRCVEIQRYVAEAVYRTRKKDDDSPFRRIVYASPAEMKAVLGAADTNSFVLQVRAETEEFIRQVDALKQRE